MAQVSVKDRSGSAAGTVDLDDAWFGIEPNVAVMHQVVTAQLAARRAGTQSTKTRAEVAGGGAKPWRQKGTGRARQGSTRNPQWRGGGVAHGPDGRDYTTNMNKKARRAALASILTDKVRKEGLAVIEAPAFDAPKTKRVVELVSNLGMAGKKVLFVLADRDENFLKSVRNIHRVKAIESKFLNPHDLLNYEHVLLFEDSIDGIAGRLTAPRIAEKTEEASS